MEMTIDGGLVCPSCGGEYLHHSNVTIFTRDGENGPSLIKSIYAVSPDKVYQKPKSPSDNPSARRDGILIDFECEGCDAQPVLAIIQHKGNTQVKWHSIRKTVKV